MFYLSYLKLVINSYLLLKLSFFMLILGVKL